MVTEERQKFPFDIQHRQIINYRTTSKSDYEKLELNITEKMIALLNIQKSVDQIIVNPIKESEGLKSHELTMLLLIMENQITNEESVSIYNLKTDMEKAGFNSIAISISVRELQRKGMIETFKESSDYNGQDFLACRLTQIGEEWMLKNQDKIEFRKPSAANNNEADNLPF